jgi:nucleoside-diphosphate-sugar epimerase
MSFGRPSTERDPVGDASPRGESERTALGFAERGVRSSVLRLPPLVHSDLDHHGFGPALIGMARARGTAGYPGDGTNRWPAVHTRDAARLYRLALEAAPAGSRLHAVAEEGVPTREIAEAIGRAFDLPVASIAPDDVRDHFGWIGAFFAMDFAATSTATRELLGWTPNGPTLVEDLGAGAYAQS